MKPQNSPAYVVLSLSFLVMFIPPHLHAASVVDQTEDPLALGYPDSRKLVQDSKGAIYIGYRKNFKEEKKNQNHIFVAKSVDNGVSWTVLNNRPIENVGDYQQRVPSLAVDSQDTVHVVWYGGDADHPEKDNHQIKYVRSTDGGRTWSNWKNIAPVESYDGGPYWQEHPVIAADGMDTLYVVWQGKDLQNGKASQIKFAKSLDRGQTWLPMVTIGKLKGASRPTILCASDNQKLYVLCYGKLGKLEQILWTVSADGGTTWSPWKEVAPSTQDQRHVSCTIDRQDHLCAVWREGSEESGKSQVIGAEFDGHSWSSPTPVGPNKEMFQSFPSVSVDDSGKATVVWTASPDSPAEHDNPNPGTIVYVVGSIGTGGPNWGPRQILSPDSQNVFASLCSTPRAHPLRAAVWLRQENINTIMFENFP